MSGSAKPTPRKKKHQGDEESTESGTFGGGRRISVGEKRRRGAAHRYSDLRSLHWHRP